MVLLKEDVIDIIHAKAAEQTLYERDPIATVYDYVGGHVDDAHEIGTSDGEIHFARRICDLVGIKYK